MKNVKIRRAVAIVTALVLGIMLNSGVPMISKADSLTEITTNAITLKVGEAWGVNTENVDELLENLGVDYKGAFQTIFWGERVVLDTEYVAPASGTGVCDAETGKTIEMLYVTDAEFPELLKQYQDKVLDEKYGKEVWLVDEAEGLPYYAKAQKEGTTSIVIPAYAAKSAEGDEATLKVTIPVVIEAAKEPMKGEEYAQYKGKAFTREENGITRCYTSEGEPVINEFSCDGEYTYFFQADGTAMRDRLTYHPDGDPKHVIYFDENGHEVFSNFANVKMTIAGEQVDDLCFFDVNGYLYVDVITYDQAGEKLYYANPYGVMECGKWFEFSDSVSWADGTPFDKAGGKYGYANADGTLMTNQQTYDWEGRPCYIQGNGVAIY